MTFPENWKCPSCSSIVYNSIKCKTCSYQPPSESGSLNYEPTTESLLGKRIAAFMIDFAFVIIIGLMIAFFIALLMPSSKGLSVMFTLFAVPVSLLMIVIHPLYFLALEGRYAQTYGKKLMKIKVVSELGQTNLKTSLPRNLTRFLEALLLYIPSIILIKRTGKRWGDKIAGAIIVKE